MTDDARARRADGRGESCLAGGYFHFPGCDRAMEPRNARTTRKFGKRSQQPGGTQRLESQGPQARGASSPCGPVAAQLIGPQSRSPVVMQSVVPFEMLRHHGGKGNTDIGLGNWSEGNYYKGEC